MASFSVLNILWLIFFTTRASVLIWMTVNLESRRITTEALIKLKNFLYIPLSIALVVTSILMALRLILKTRGQSKKGKKMKILDYIYVLLFGFTSIASLVATIGSFARLQDKSLGLVLVSFFPALVIYAIGECCLFLHTPENEESMVDHQQGEPEYTLGHEDRLTQFQGDGSVNTAAVPGPLSCSGHGCRWRTPRGVADLATMVELMRLHTQQAHPVFVLPGGGGMVWRGGEVSYPSRESEEGDKQPTAPPPPSYDELSD